MIWVWQSFFICDRVSLCNTVWPDTPRDPAASASQELGLKMCATTPRRVGCFCDLSGGSDSAGLFCCADCQYTTVFSTLLVAVTRCLRRSPLKEGRDYCDSQFEDTVHHGWESMGAGTVCSYGSRNLGLLAHILVDPETQRRMSVPTFPICTI